MDKECWKLKMSGFKLRGFGLLAVGLTLLSACHTPGQINETVGASQSVQIAPAGKRKVQFVNDCSAVGVEFPSLSSGSKWNDYSFYFSWGDAWTYYKLDPDGAGTYDIHVRRDIELTDEFSGYYTVYTVARRFSPSEGGLVVLSEDVYYCPYISPSPSPIQSLSPSTAPSAAPSVLPSVVPSSDPDPNDPFPDDGLQIDASDLPMFLMQMIPQLVIRTAPAAGTAAVPATAKAVAVASAKSAVKTVPKGISKTVTERASEIVARLNKNSVTINTANQRIRIDLAGKAHFDKTLGKSIPTPHVTIYQKNINPIDPTKVSFKYLGVRPAVMNDIRTVEKVLKDRGAL